MKCHQCNNAYRLSYSYCQEHFDGRLIVYNQYTCTNGHSYEERILAPEEDDTDEQRY